MAWPLRTKSSTEVEFVIGRTIRSDDLLYYPRPAIEHALKFGMTHSPNVVLYGPSHQGKTTLLARHLAPADSIIIECRPGFKRMQIYRVILASLGYSVLTEKKKRGKATASFKLGVGTTGAKIRGDKESEQTMQSITIDLRNPTEVAHLISRLKRLPWIVLNNFQFLDRGTKKNLLFDLAFFSERPGIRTIIVGAWSNDDYLEEIEPAIAGKYRPVLVPMWLDEELRAAAAEWLGRSKGRPTVATHMDDYLALSHGDISLFRALIESSKVNGESSPLRPESSTPVRTSQALVLGRFRRGLNRTLRAMRAQREAFLTYHAIRLSIRIMHNPRYVSRTTFTASDKYVLSYLNPYTGKPYSDGRIVSVDPEGNPDDIEESVYEVALMNVDIIEHLLEVFHETVQQGSQEIPLTRLVQDFIDVLVPQPIAIDKSKVKAVFLRLEELQRKALIAPPLFLVDGARDTLRIVDRRLFLFLAGVNADDLEDLLEEAQPRKTPRAARRNHVSPHMTDAEKVAYAARVQANVLSTDGETSGLQGSSSGGIYNPDGQA